MFDSQRHAEPETATADATPAYPWWVLAGLVVLTLFVAVVAFVWSFHGLDDYGRTVEELEGMSYVVPLGVDGLTLVSVAATFLLRQSHWRVRLYAWSMFGVAVSLSIAGNVSHGQARHLTWQGMLGAAVAPVILALSTHQVVVVWRELDRRRASARLASTLPPIKATATQSYMTVPVDEPAVEALEPAPQTNGNHPITSISPISIAPLGLQDTLRRAAEIEAEQAREKITGQPTRRRTAAPRASTRKSGSHTSKPDEARHLVAGGMSCAEVAMRLGASKRSVERWTTGVRAPGGEVATS
jgi:DNA-binding transcriptional regulator YiaG